MPLKPGRSRAVISSNISELTHHGSRPRSHRQIVAIALSNADKHPRASSGPSMAEHERRHGSPAHQPAAKGGPPHPHRNLGAYLHKAKKR